MLTHVTKTAAGYVETARLGGDSHADEDQHESRQDRQTPAIETTKDQGEAAENFEPGQKKSEPHTDEPGERFVIVDIQSELDGIENLQNARVSKNTADDYGHNSPNKSWPS